jgi:anhydro-N-acetylmuramic acid kinase
MTIVGPTLADLRAFDSGPGNMALDEVARVESGGADGYDAGGARAARGTIDRSLIAELFAHPFFATPAPRSTGREAFGAAWTAPLIARHAGKLDDLLATLTRFTAEAIHRSWKDLGGPAQPADVVVSGGGVHNATLMAHLAELFAPAPVVTSAADGFDPDAMEAIAFAILANETLFGNPGDVPAATGARGPRVLGKIVPP